MRLAATLTLALLWQAGDFTAPRTDAPSADPQHMRYERALVLASGSAGMACTVLDATAFAHAASRSADDLRIFRVNHGGARVADGSAPVETPFALSENQAQPDEVVSAVVQNLGERNGNLVFDLAMPQRVYSEVDLQLAAKDFIATAKVSGSDGKGGPVTSLGSFALFDLTQQHLSRSATLPLQESTFARLHVELHVTTPAGAAFAGLAPAMVVGASVPASREAQTVYSVVAATNVVQQIGASTEAKIDVPAHVPVERVSFLLDPAYKREFLRYVAIGAGKGSAQESVEGEIWRVTRGSAEGGPAIHDAKLSVDAVMASNLQGPATITIAVKNGNDVPLPIRSVQLEMRQRMVCFEASGGSSYTLRYGDVALRAPVYDIKASSDFMQLNAGEVKPLVASLGPEVINPDFQERADTRPYSERHPGILWIGLLLVVGALAATALHSVKQQGRKV